MNRIEDYNKSIQVIHFATKEQDELSQQFIDEWLNE